MPAIAELQVWRFDDGVVRSHVIAASEAEATEIFDRHLGREYREEFDDVVIEVYPLSGDVELPISFDGSRDFVTKTAAEWIEFHGAPHFL